MRISRVHHPVTALGAGVRVGLWTQGCAIACRGCVSRDTWDPAGGVDIPVDRLLDRLGHVPGRVDGLTITGGEPSDQPTELTRLLIGARDVAGDRGEVWDILLYSGREGRALRRQLPHIESLVDALVEGPYRAELGGDDALRGSSNQRLVLTTPLAHERYRDVASWPRRLDVAVTDDTLYLVGIPRPRDLDRLNDALAGSVRFGTTSWQPTKEDDDHAAMS